RDEREPAVRLVGVEAAVGEKADALAEDAAVEPAPGAAVGHEQLAARRRAAEERGARLEEPLDAIAQLLAGLAEGRSDGDRHLRVARARRELLVRTGEEERLGQLLEARDVEGVRAAGDRLPRHGDVPAVGELELDVRSVEVRAEEQRAARPEDVARRR